MAASIDFSQFTFTADEVRQFNELIVKKFITTPGLNEFHNIYTGIRNDRQIGLVNGTFGLLGKAAQGCDPTADSNQISSEQKTWEPKRIGIYLEQCWTDISDTFAQFARNLGVDVVDLTNTEYWAFLESVLGKDIPLTIFRHAWFGDQSAANYSDSPAGTITDGVDTDYFNVINGFFYQLNEIIVADADRNTSLNAYNGQATKALQFSTLTPTLAASSINDVIDAAPAWLRSQADQVIITTASVGRKAMRYLQSQGLAFDITLQTDGLTVTRWDGIPIYVVDWFDYMINLYENNGTKLNNPHRIVYTTKSNLALGMEGTNLFDTFKIFHDDKSEKSYIRAKDAFDAKVLQDDLVQYGI